MIGSPQVYTCRHYPAPPLRPHTAAAPGSSLLGRRGCQANCELLLLAGGFPHVLFPPLWCFPPRCFAAVPPPVFRRCCLYDPVATPCPPLGPHRAAVSQTRAGRAAARPGTTLSVPAPGRPPDHHQLFRRHPEIARHVAP